MLQRGKSRLKPVPQENDFAESHRRAKEILEEFKEEIDSFPITRIEAGVTESLLKSGSKKRERPSQIRERKLFL